MLCFLPNQNVESVQLANLLPRQNIVLERAKMPREVVGWCEDKDEVNVVWIVFARGKAPVHDDRNDESRGANLSEKRLKLFNETTPRVGGLESTEPAFDFTKAALMDA